MTPELRERLAAILALNDNTCAGRVAVIAALAALLAEEG